MTPQIPTTEPQLFVAGETLIWRKSLSDYPPGNGWTLKYSWRSQAGGFDVTADADGSAYKITVPSSSTQSLAATTIFWQAWVENGDASEKHFIGRGQATVEAAFQAPDVVYDGRSPVKRILDAIDALVAGKASLDQQEYTIGNRSLRRIPITELIALRDKYARLYASQQQKARLREGAPFFKNILTRFTDH
jgi:hypothetical protein